MSQTALARRYRPRRFGEVTAQAHVSETLRKAVLGDRVGHAYLFCGPRGVGKTTAARVLAMALNCPERRDDGEPCGECDSCQRIWSGHTSLDVVEIDAASNRGVDDARDLRERAMYAPSGDARYKVYIVDEAHMLTREAWNALLKILEEPPPRVIFAFATTEPQKIEQAAAPILSRCQRFDFRRIGVRDVVERLETVLQAEAAEYEPEALHALARKADGGMRDALSLTDQVLSLTGTGVTLDAVRQVLGLVAEERYLELYQILAEARHRDVFTFVEALVADGYDLVGFYHGLMQGLRTLLRVRLGEDLDGLGVPGHLEEALQGAAANFEPGDLVRMLSLAAELETTGNLRRIPDPRVLIELLLVRLSFLERTASIEALLEGLGPVEGGGGGGSAAPSRSSGTGESAKVAPASGGTAANRAPADARTREASPAAPASEPQARRAPAAAAGPSPSTGSPESTPPASTRSARTSPSPLSLHEAWGQVTSGAAGVPAGLTSFLKAAQVNGEPDGSVRVALPAGPGLDRMGKPAVQAAVAAALGTLMGSAPHLVVVSADGDDRGPERVTQQTVRETRLQELLAAEPGLQAAVEELDLELLD